MCTVMPAQLITNCIGHISWWVRPRVSRETIFVEGKKMVAKEPAKHIYQRSRITFSGIGSIVSFGDRFNMMRSLLRSLSGDELFRSAKDYYSIHINWLSHKDATLSGGTSRFSFLREIPLWENLDSSESFRAADEDYYRVYDWGTPTKIARYVRLYNKLKEALDAPVDFESREFLLAHADLNTTNLFIDLPTYEIADHRLGTCVYNTFRAISCSTLSALHTSTDWSMLTSRLHRRIRSLYWRQSGGPS